MSPTDPSVSPPAPPSAVSTSPPTPASTSVRRQRSAGHVIAIVTGVFVLVPALALLFGGSALLIGGAVAADDDGYFRYTLERVESDGVAVAATDLWLDDADGDAPWVFDWLDVDLRLRVEGAGGTDEVFVGVARTVDVEAYFDGAAWSEVVEIDGRTAVTEDVVGRGSVVPPAELDIWTASATGSDLEELTWRARGGDWSVVIMNADGSAEVTADVELGARSGAITPIGVTMLVVGGVGLVLAVVAIVVGARGRPSDDPPARHDAPTTRPAPPSLRVPAPDRPVDAAAGRPLPPPPPQPAVPTDSEPRSESAMAAR